MAADVLLYNALNESNRFLINANATLDTNIAAQNALCTTALNQIASGGVGLSTSLIQNAGPNQANLWCLIPTLPATGTAWTDGLKVCDTSGNFRCGATCSWTVPAGVTCARFQLWGAGAGRGYGCCCAFTPFGGTGAYASVIIPVTAGDSYTICAGCAFCCYMTPGGSNVNGQPGCPSYVTGTGLSNFCAEGGEASLYCELLTRCICGISQAAYCMFLGGCICSNGSVCWHGDIAGGGQGGAGSPACCFDNMFPMISSCKTYYGSATSGTVYGIRGSYGSIAVNCNTSICVQHPPIYGFPTTSCCTENITTNDSNGCCRSANAATPYMQVPGAGSWALMRCGGGTSGAADAGRMGMVCVSYL